MPIPANDRPRVGSRGLRRKELLKCSIERHRRPAYNLRYPLQYQARAELGLSVSARSIRARAASMSSPKYPRTRAALPRTDGSSVATWTARWARLIAVGRFASRFSVQPEPSSCGGEEGAE